MMNELQNSSTLLEHLSYMLDISLLFVSCLSFAGFDVMLLANNHMNDYGDKPVNLTVNILKKLGIQSLGINYGPYDAPQVSDITTHT